MSATIDRRSASERLTALSAAIVLRVLVISFTAASELTAQCETSSARAPA
jgi:hypothetical protein